MTVQSERNSAKTHCPRGHEYDSFDGRSRRCSACDAETQRRYTDRNHEAELARLRELSHRADQQRKRRNNHLIRTYGITIEQEEAMIAAQGGVCAICRAEAKLCVDHSSETGEIRGMLCHSCNLALGKLCDDPDRILAMHRYLTDR